MNERKKQNAEAALKRPKPVKTVVDWDVVIPRFHQMMKTMYRSRKGTRHKKP
jgi:hypothetical protein